MEINYKQIIEGKNIYFMLYSLDQKEIHITLSLSEYKKINDLDIIDCAKIAYNDISTKPTALKAESAIDLEGTKLYMSYWKIDDDGMIEIEGIRVLSEHDFKAFIDYRNESQRLN